MLTKISNVIYLDNNATTCIPNEVVNEMVKWVNTGNPSASYAENSCRKLLLALRSMIATKLRFKMNDMDGYTILYTSGASESNSHILQSCARAFAKKNGLMPHIIVSEVEHKSIIECCKQMVEEKMCQVSYVPIKKSGEQFGCVDVEQIRQLIRPTTCLVSIMAVNNESGVMNDITSIGKLCKQNNIPFHSDIVQLFGKSEFYPIEHNVDAMSLSFHKIHGPSGVGALIIRNSLIMGYDLKPIIYGTQNYGLRGGTENIIGIAGAYRALDIVQQIYPKANDRIAKKRNYIKETLTKYYPTCYISDYNPNHRYKTAIVWLSPKFTKLVVGWTLFMAVDQADFCNVKMKKKLEKNNIIVSVGSACNTSSKSASHVVYAMNLPDRLKPGVMRISLSHETTDSDVQQFCKVFIHYLNRGN